MDNKYFKSDEGSRNEFNMGYNDYEVNKSCKDYEVNNDYKDYDTMLGDTRTAPKC